MLGASNSWVVLVLVAVSLSLAVLNYKEEFLSGLEGDFKAQEPEERESITSMQVLKYRPFKVRRLHVKVVMLHMQCMPDSLT